MTDFVTRLENQLHATALRRERAGVVRRVALPRARLALGDLPMATLAIVLLALALAGAAIMLGSSPQRAAQGDLPGALRGVWRAGPTELRLYPRGAAGCATLDPDDRADEQTGGPRCPRVGTTVPAGRRRLGSPTPPPTPRAHK